MPTVTPLRHIARRLARAPMFTIITLITLAVGIGANTAISSIINGVLLKPLPYPESDRLVAVWQTAPGINLPEINASPATYFTYREEGRTFEDIGLYRNDSVTVTGLAEPEQVQALFVTDGTLPLLRVNPVVGRWFSRKDDQPGSPKTAMLTYGYWQRRFGASTSALGKRLMIDGEAHEIIGVMPAGFQFMNRRAGLILPFQLDRSKVFIGNFSYEAVARLKPGETLATASMDVARMIPIMMHKFPPAPGVSLQMFESAHFGPNLRSMKQEVIGSVGNTLWILMATVGIVLLIACANVANLMLVRAEARQQEFAIRSALGASRMRLARELLGESVTLGVIGGVLGACLAYAALQLLVWLAPSGLPRINEIQLNGPVLFFTIAISLLAGVLFGLIPVYKYAGAGPAMSLREGGRNASDGRQRHHARNSLVVVQVALALVLLISSGLMLRTLMALQQISPGFTDPAHIQTVRVSIPSAQVPDDVRAARMHQEIMRKVSEIPGVTAVALTNSVTMDGYTDNDPIGAEDHPFDEGKIPPLRRFKFISPGYFKAMGRPLLIGRDLTWQDIYSESTHVLVSENLARELWHDPAKAIGKRIKESPTSMWREIVGVVSDERDDGVDKKAPTVVYWPFLLRHFWQFDSRLERGPALVIRSDRAGSAAFVKELERAVWSVNPDMPLAEIRTVEETYRRSMARTSFTLVMLAIASGMALLLGIVGIYGVIAYSVSQRTREIGIRVALGAEPSAVQAMFVRHGLMLTGIGVALGMAVAFSVTRLMKSLLFEVSPVDPLTYSAVAVLLLLAASLAAYIPARRATRIEASEALRME